MLTDALLATLTVAFLFDAWVTRKWIRTNKVYLDELRAHTASYTITEQTYQLSVNGAWFKCLLCGLTSFHPKDVQHRFCSKCRVFHFPGGRLSYEHDPTGKETPR